MTYQHSTISHLLKRYYQLMTSATSMYLLINLLIQKMVGGRQFLFFCDQKKIFLQFCQPILDPSTQSGKIEREQRKLQTPHPYFLNSAEKAHSLIGQKQQHYEFKKIWKFFGEQQPNIMLEHGFIRFQQQLLPLHQPPYYFDALQKQQSQP
eukprot:TRINITY_DN9772_c0_g1_i1.p3 TRINITY_DN9772_c0_g1~~TRINITY_DN9772_c0_g1_i1.p3  ORF type:complete len:151 (+),score=6.47 TRINITY_DN9772_c0_g1_i1:296-748(+)